MSDKPRVIHSDPDIWEVRLSSSARALPVKRRGYLEAGGFDSTSSWIIFQRKPRQAVLS